MTGTLGRRLGAVERRMGVDRTPLGNFTDLDLLGAIQWVSELLAAQGAADSIATLAEHDAEEAKLRAFHERPDVAASCTVQLEPDVRWPYLRARARHWENGRHQGPASAQTAEDLARKIGAALAAMKSAL